MKRLWIILSLIIVVGGFLPLIHYWYSVGKVPGVSIQKANEMLAEANDNIVLIDIRNFQAYNEKHIEGAINWPYKDIMSLTTDDMLPQSYSGKTLLLICDGGIDSARAVSKLRKTFQADALNIKGGMQAWIANIRRSSYSGRKLVSSFDPLSSVTFKDSPISEQLALSAAVLIIKPLYMLISLLLIIVLWRQKASDLISLKLGLIFFLAGETFCAFNIALFDHGNYLFEFFHMYGMVLGFAFVVYALIEALDNRVINYSNPQKKCSLLGLCQQCIKYTEVPCAARRFFYFIIASFIIISFMPILASINVLSYNTSILGLPFNYSHPVLYQIFEFRYAPVYAIVLLVAALIFLLTVTEKTVIITEILLAAGVGALAFSFLRLTFWGIYHDNFVWPNFWEELTELLYVTGVGIVLWLFRKSIFKREVNTA